MLRMGSGQSSTTCFFEQLQVDECDSCADVPGSFTGALCCFQEACEKYADDLGGISFDSRSYIVVRGRLLQEVMLLRGIDYGIHICVVMLGRSHEIMFLVAYGRLGKAEFDNVFPLAASRVDFSSAV